MVKLPAMHCISYELEISQEKILADITTQYYLDVHAELWGAIAQWSEHLQLKQEALGSIPGGYTLGFFLFQLAY